MPPKRKTKKAATEASPAKKTKETGDDESKTESDKKKAADKPKLNRTDSDYSSQDFTSDAKTSDGRKWNWKIASWNINGLRAWLDKDGLSYIKHEQPDVLCLQEIKCDKESIPDTTKIDGYHSYWYSADEAGYAGTGLYSKTKPINVTYGMGIEKHDGEGRIITAEYDKFFLVTSYVPNSGRGLPRLGYRTKEWEADMREYLKKLDNSKPVVFCGDLNVAHLEIDLKNPKTNKKTAGFTPQEREEFGALLEEGFIDSFRELYPEQEEAYTFWTFMGNARSKNVGWRLDYFVLSKRMKEDLCDNIIRKDVFGSDHCPIVLLLSLGKDEPDEENAEEKDEENGEEKE